MFENRMLIQKGFCHNVYYYVSRKTEGQVEKIRFLSNELIANTLIGFFLGFIGNLGLFKDFWRNFVLSSAKKIRRRNFHDPWGGHIVQYRYLETPYPPKKVRCLLWTAPCAKPNRLFDTRIITNRFLYCCPESKESMASKD